MRSLLPWLLIGFGGAASAQSLASVGTLKAATDARFTAISPDGKQIAAACRDLKIRLFTSPGGVPTQTLDPGDMRVSSLAYSRDGRRLAAGGPGAAQVFDTKTGQRVAAISGLGERVDAVALSPEGQKIALAPGESPAQLWEVAPQKRLASLATRFSGSTALAFSPDGKIVVSSNADTTVRAFAATTGAPAWTFDELDLEPFALDFSPDSKTLVVAGADKVAVTLDAATGKSTHRLPRQPDPIGAVTILGDGRTVIAFCLNADKMAETRAILAWDLSTGVVKTVGEGQSFNGGGMVADGRLLLTAPGKDGLELWAIR